MGEVALHTLQLVEVVVHCTLEVLAHSIVEVGLPVVL